VRIGGGVNCGGDFSWIVARLDSVIGLFHRWARDLDFRNAASATFGRWKNFDSEADQGLYLRSETADRQPEAVRRLRTKNTVINAAYAVFKDS
jgi:hypothetical protein